MAALFVNQLTTLDFSYLCPERGLVGETWLVDVILRGELDEQGMVFDFGHVKKQIKSSLDLLADHRLLVPVNQPGVTITSSDSQLTVRMKTNKQGIVECKAPCQAILLVDAAEITTDTLTPFLEHSLMSELPGNVSGVSLKLYPEYATGSFYHYSHGLKKHLGDCQRIAHGHRSLIDINIDGQRAPELEENWAQRWKDIYLAKKEDLLNTFTQDGFNYHQFGYTSDQGYFELTLATDRCYLIETDTTVELLAEHIARTLSEKQPGKKVMVRAYEGFQKGALAEYRVDG